MKFAAKTIITAVVAVAIGCGGASSPTSETTSPAAPPEATPSAATEAPVVAVLPDQLAAFERVWQRIEQTHWDRELVGEKWRAARDELRPKVAAAKTPAEARAVIRELLAKLGQSHFALIARELEDAMFEPEDDGAPERGTAGGEDGALGLDIRVIGDQVVVVEVEPKSPAAVAKIKPGAVLVEVAGVSVTERIAKRRAAIGAKPFQEARLVLGALSGKTGTKVKITVAERRGNRTVELTRKPSSVKIANLLGMPIPIRYESRWLKNGSVGYVRLTSFADPTMVNRRYKADIARFAVAKGIVIDLRGNPGGLGGMAAGMLGYLVNEPTQIGTQTSRNSTLKYIANPQPGAFGGKVAVLVDGHCASTCEILAGGLTFIKRGKTFGTTTAGAALPSLFERLPSGDTLQFAVANYQLPDGSTLEGGGHKPTVVVERTVDSLLAGKDVQLDAAVRWISTGKTR